MKFPVLWLSFVNVWEGIGKVIYLAWDLGSRSYITLHFCAKAVKRTLRGYFLHAYGKKFSYIETAHAQTKYQKRSTSGRGARAPYLTMFPEISAR